MLFLIVSHFATPINDFTLLKRDMIFFPHCIAPCFKGSPFYAHCLSLFPSPQSIRLELRVCEIFIQR